VIILVNNYKRLILETTAVKDSYKEGSTTSTLPEQSHDICMNNKIQLELSF